MKLGDLRIMFCACGVELQEYNLDTESFDTVWSGWKTDLPHDYDDREVTIITTSSEKNGYLTIVF